MPTTVRSFAKINLGLAIGPPRADGYHALTTLYQTVATHDLVTVSATPAATAAIAVRCSDERVPCDARNTVWKMAERALASLDRAAQVEIHIEKRLPVQGGLGAGSANAVAALIGLERELALADVEPLSGPERLRIAAAVGSDVPLFLIGGAVLGVGRGEEVFPLPDLPPVECVIALPDVGVSTPQAFRDWDARHTMPAGPAPGLTLALTPSGGSDRLNWLSRALASAFCPRPPLEISAGDSSDSSGVSTESGSLAENGNPLLALVRTGIENDFEEVVFRQHPSLGTIKRVLAGSGSPEETAVYAALSGSGSALFGLYRTAAAADAAAARLSTASVRSLRTKTLPRDEYWRTMLEAG